MKSQIPLMFFVLALVSCSRTAYVEIRPFGELSTGEEVTLWHIENSSGASVDVVDFGCRIVSIHMPDKDGKLDDVVVGYGNIQSFEKGDRFIGPVLGRYANRLDGASFVLDGRRYSVDANECLQGVPVQCHGGTMGFDRYLWKGVTLAPEEGTGVRFTRLSPDGEQGFPGNLQVSVTYKLTEDNVLRIEYGAVTDKPTVVNLSNHTYFNMRSGAGSYVMEQRLCVNADSCIRNNGRYCPDKVVHVEGTPFDFRSPRRIDYRIDMPDQQLSLMRGMSVCWKIRDWDGSLRKAADLFDPLSGRGVETWTTEPAILTVTGRNFSAEKYHDGKYGPIEKFSGMLLETMHFADSPNQSRFPSTVLRPGERYFSVTEFRFYTSSGE